MPDCANIIFGQAVIQISYEHKLKQERTNKILITVANVCFFIYL